MNREHELVDQDGDVDEEPFTDAKPYVEVTGGRRFRSVGDVPDYLKPLVNAQPIEDIPFDAERRRGPGAREAVTEGTYWCRSCITTVPTAATTWCAACALARDALRKRLERTRRATAQEHLFELDALEAVLAQTYRMVDLLGPASMEFQRLGVPTAAIDEYMREAKKLVDLARDSLKPGIEVLRERKRAAGLASPSARRRSR